MLLSLKNLAEAEYSPAIANLAIDRQRNRILTTKATREAIELADAGKNLVSLSLLQHCVHEVPEEKLSFTVSSFFSVGRCMYF